MLSCVRHGRVKKESLWGISFPCLSNFLISFFPITPLAYNVGPFKPFTNRWELFLLFHNALSVWKEWHVWTAGRPVQHPNSFTIKPCCTVRFGFAGWKPDFPSYRTSFPLQHCARFQSSVICEPKYQSNLWLISLTVLTFFSTWGLYLGSLALWHSQVLDPSLFLGLNPWRVGKYFPTTLFKGLKKKEKEKQ